MTAVHSLIIQKKIELADLITRLHFEHNPGLLKRYGAAGKERCHEDAVFHLNFLAEALKMEHQGMYANYILWAAAMLRYRNVPKSDLLDNLDYVFQAVRKILGENAATAIDPYITHAKEELHQKAREPETYITDDNPYKDEVIRYLNLLLDGKRQEAGKMIYKLVEQGTEIKEIYQHIFQVSQYEVGHLWQCNKITVAHEHYCTAATQLIMSGLYKHIFSSERNGKSLVACSISGELHEMGIRMVTDFFEMDGWDTYYLGANMPDRQLQQALAEYKADVLAISVTLPTHVSKVAALIDQIKNNSDNPNLKILVGGYPFLNNPGLWQKVKADGFAKNADQAIATAVQLTI